MRRGTLSRRRGWRWLIVSMCWRRRGGGVEGRWWRAAVSKSHAGWYQHASLQQPLDPSRGPAQHSAQPSLFDIFIESKEEARHHHKGNTTHSSRRSKAFAAAHSSASVAFTSAQGRRRPPSTRSPPHRAGACASLAPLLPLTSSPSPLFSRSHSH